MAAVNHTLKGDFIEETATTVTLDLKAYRRLTCKVRRYERFLFRIQHYAEFTLNGEGVRALIGNACRWANAHRDGNGSLSEQEVARQVNAAFRGLLIVQSPDPIVTGVPDP